MTAQIILWIYIGLLVGGGMMGFIKGGSKISLISSVAFAVPLILCDLKVIEFQNARWVLIVLLFVPPTRSLASSNKTFCPACFR